MTIWGGVAWKKGVARPTPMQHDVCMAQAHMWSSAPWLVSVLGAANTSPC